ncbi:MAG: hypothetical protein WDM89_18865 [Rhizomicrobium sp.]
MAFPREWIAGMRNAFLIRAPEDVLRSYVQKRENVTLEDIGFVSQRELFDRESDRLGVAPPVIQGEDVPSDPHAVLSALCSALDIPFLKSMLSWPAGKRDTDGAWAPVWYASVERSTGFSAPQTPVSRGPLPANLQRIVDAARPHYEAMRKFRLL